MANDKNKKKILINNITFMCIHNHTYIWLETWSESEFLFEANMVSTGDGTWF